MAPGPLTDGQSVVPNLVNALKEEGHGRGLHTGSFLWDGNGIDVEGEISGLRPSSATGTGGRPTATVGTHG